MTVKGFCWVAFEQRSGPHLGVMYERVQTGALQSERTPSAGPEDVQYCVLGDKTQQNGRKSVHHMGGATNQMN